MPDPSFQNALSEAVRRVEAILDELLPSASDGPVAEAMRHATLNGGKRLRAFLVIEGARLFNVPEMQADRTAAAIECIHAYSLIHDDLPCMDDDDLRRGEPTVHKKWDEATAVLAGDALQSLAFEIMAHPRTAPDAAIRLKLIARLAETSGFNGMVGGQALDIAAEDAKVPLTLEEITALQSKKTGALISWAAEAGPTLGKSDISPMTEYAKNIGLAFQIQDDILDVTGTADVTGKKVGKDEDAGKATFVSIMGLEGAKGAAKALVEDAGAALASYHSAAHNLKACADYIITRDK